MAPETGREGTGGRGRGLIFALLVAVCVGIAAAVVTTAAREGDSEGAGGADVSAGDTGSRSVVFQHLAGGAGTPGYAKAALARTDRPAGRRKVTSLTCERIHFAAGHGLCLVPATNPVETSYKAIIVGPDFRPRKELSMPGIASRARVSQDGRWGATTGFVAGHSYLDAGFSTQASLIDMRRGATVANLEKDFTVIRDGEPFKKADFNFWGVTFKRSGEGFFATLRTGSTTYLVEADIKSRKARVLHRNVECPSLSPDETRVAYKKRVGQGWRLHVLDLETMRETPLAEPQSVDDQVEWLNDNEILYGLSSDIWAVPADGSGKPRTFIRAGLSPAVLRGD